jgi:DNA-binding MarR family transcriptional regulator
MIAYASIPAYDGHMAKTAELASLSEQEMEAWHAFIRSHARLVRLLEAELEAEHGLTLSAYEVLAHLSEAPERRLRMSDLAALVVQTPSGLTRLVDKLGREGLVERVRCGSDARVVYATITAEGMRRLRKAYPTHLRGVRQHLLDRLAPHQLEVIAEALGPLTSNCRSLPASCS